MINPLLKYKAYHHDKINIVIHQACVPLLLMSFYSVVPIYLAFVVNTFYSVNYLWFDVFSTISINKSGNIHWYTKSYPTSVFLISIDGNKKTV